MRKASPLSLKLTLKMIRDAKALDYDSVLKREFNVSYNKVSNLGRNNMQIQD